jgi:hypothetical protein
MQPAVLQYINAVWSLVAIYSGLLLALTGTAIAVGEIRAFMRGIVNRSGA